MSPYFAIQSPRIWSRQSPTISAPVITEVISPLVSLTRKPRPMISAYDMPAPICKSPALRDSTEKDSPPRALFIVRRPLPSCARARSRVPRITVPCAVRPLPASVRIMSARPVIVPARLPVRPGRFQLIAAPGFRPVLPFRLSPLSHIIQNL